MARCGDAHTLSLLNERTNHSSAREGFASTGRTLNRQHCVVEFVCDTDRELHRRLRIAGGEWTSAKRRRIRTQQPLNERRVGTGGNTLASPKDRVLEDLGRHVSVRKERCRMGLGVLLSFTHIQRPRDPVCLNDFTKLGAVCQLHVVAGAESPFPEAGIGSDRRRNP